MLRVISSKFKYSQFREEYNPRPGQFKNQDEADENWLKHGTQYTIHGSLNDQEQDLGNDSYADENEAISKAHSIISEFFPSRTLDRVWVEKSDGEFGTPSLAFNEYNDHELNQENLM